MSDLAVRACDELAERHEALRAEIARIATACEESARDGDRLVADLANEGLDAHRSTHRLIEVWRATARGLRAALEQAGAR